MPRNEKGDSVVGCGYQFFMLVLCLFSIGAIALRTAVHLEPEVAGVIDYADYLVCAIFFVDFLISLWHAPNRLKYFLTWGWLDLLSSLPMLDYGRWGRIARIVRLLRVLRATKIVTGAILRRRAENGLLAASLATLLLLIICSVLILQTENDPASNIKSAEDAMWWALSTITTVGYGDRYPVTTEGRIIASVLMICGVALLSTLSGFFAAWFLSPGEKQESELADLRKEIAALRESIEKLAHKDSSRALSNNGSQGIGEI